MCGEYRHQRGKVHELRHKRHAQRHRGTQHTCCTAAAVYACAVRAGPQGEAADKTRQHAAGEARSSPTQVAAAAAMSLTVW
jgi:hypothetical protein